MSESFRNHPVALLKAAIMYVFMATFFWAVFMTEAGLPALAALELLAAIGIAVSFMIWRRTTVSFDEKEITYLKDTALNKVQKRIPYSRLASVGVTRSILDRLVGTTVLTFNVNSGVNSTTPEAALVLDSIKADELRDKLNRMIFVKEETVEEDREKETMVNVSNSEIVIHSILSQSTLQFIWALFLLSYSVYSLINDNSGGMAITLLLFLFSTIAPIVSKIMKYSNYRLYRVGDTITVESGLLSTTRVSFKISKVNAVILNRPLFARIFGMASLEAEVIGLQAGGDRKDASPLLCPLKMQSDVRALMSRLVPEAIFEATPARQPTKALASLGTMAAASCIVSIAIAVLVAVFLDSVDPEDAVILNAFIAFFGFLVPPISVGWLVLAYRNRSFALGPESFMVTTGAYDTHEQYVFYDKVQMTHVCSGPVTRRYGLSVLKIAILSSNGAREIDSGIFDGSELDRVSAEVMGRIRDGRYDCHRYE